LVFIFPVGHEQATVRRWPVITICIVALCCLVHAAVFPRIEREQKRAFDLEARMSTLKIQLYFKYSARGVSVIDQIAQHPSRNVMDLARDIGAGIDAFWDQFVNGEIVPKDDPDYLQYELLAGEIEELSENNVLSWFAFRPGGFHWWTLITALFLHGGVLHLLGNMYFLYLVGCNIEDVWGRPVYLLVYLFSGVAAFAAHAAMFKGSMIPVIGASGAIAGVMGAFLVRYFKVRIRFYWFFIIMRIHKGQFHLPAYVVLPAWLAYQVWAAAMYGDAVDVAFHAHVGGFVFGAGAALLLRLTSAEERMISPLLEKKIEGPEFVQDQRLVRGADLIARGDPEGALALFREMLTEDPENLTARVEAFRALALLEQRGEAKQEAADLIKVLLSRNEEEEALQIHREALTCDPGFCAGPRDAYRLGRLLEGQDDHENAVRTYQNLTATWPRFELVPKALLNAARILKKKMADDRGAFEMYRKLVLDHPGSDLVSFAKQEMKKMPGGQIVFD